MENVIDRIKRLGKQNAIPVAGPMPQAPAPGEGIAQVDEREQAIIDRHTNNAPGVSFLKKAAKGLAKQEIETRKQQRAYAEKPPTPLAQMTVDPAREMVANLGNRAKVLDTIRKLSPEQRQEALKLVPGIAQQLGDDRGGVAGRIGGAVSRGISHGVSQPIQELVGLGGTAEEIEYIRQLDAAASQEFSPARPGDPWYASGPLQAVEMAPWMTTVVGGAGIGRAGVSALAGRVAARGAAGGKIAGAVTQAGKVVGKTGLTAGKAGELAGTAYAAFPSQYAQEVDQLKALGMQDGTNLRLLAGGTAAITGLVEGIVPNPFKAGPVPLTEGAVKAARQYLFNAAKQAPGEMTEEYLQGVTSGLGEHVAQYLDANAEDKSLGDALRKGWDQGKEAALPMAFLLGVPAIGGAGLSAAQAQRLTRLKEIRAKGPVSRTAGRELGIEAEKQEDRTAQADAEIQQLEQESAQVANPVPPSVTPEGTQRATPWYDFGTGEPTGPVPPPPGFGLVDRLRGRSAQATPPASLQERMDAIVAEGKATRQRGENTDALKAEFYRLQAELNRTQPTPPALPPVSDMSVTPPAIPGTQPPALPKGRKPQPPLPQGAPSASQVPTNEESNDVQGDGGKGSQVDSGSQVRVEGQDQGGAKQASQEPATPQVQVATPEGKAPWELTRSEHVAERERRIAEFRRLSDENGGGPEAMKVPEVAEAFRSQEEWSDLDMGHKPSVKKAVKEGKPVPASVLAEYPDISAPKPPVAPAPKPTEAITAPSETKQELDTLAQYQIAWKEKSDKRRGFESKPLAQGIIDSLRTAIDNHAATAIARGRSTKFATDDSSFDELELRAIQDAVRSKGYEVGEIERSTEDGEDFVGFDVIGKRAPETKPPVAPAPKQTEATAPSERDQAEDELAGLFGTEETPATKPTEKPKQESKPVWDVVKGKDGKLYRQNPDPNLTPKQRLDERVAVDPAEGVVLVTKDQSGKRITSETLTFRQEFVDKAKPGTEFEHNGYKGQSFKVLDDGTLLNSSGRKMDKVQDMANTVEPGQIKWKEESPTTAPEKQSSEAPAEKPPAKLGTKGVIKPARKMEPTEEGRPADGKPIIPGDRFVTNTGRETTPYPKYSGSTNRQAINAEKKSQLWLMENAIAEAESRGDDFNLTTFRSELEDARKGKLPQASKDSATLYVFGESIPEVPKPLLKPLVKPQENLSQDKKPSVSAKPSADQVNVDSGEGSKVKQTAEKPNLSPIGDKTEVEEPTQTSGKQAPVSEEELRQNILDAMLGEKKAPEKPAAKPTKYSPAKPKAPKTEATAKGVGDYEWKKGGNGIEAEGLKGYIRTIPAKDQIAMDGPAQDMYWISAPSAKSPEPRPQNETHYSSLDEAKKKLIEANEKYGKKEAPKENPFAKVKEAAQEKKQEAVKDYDDAKQRFRDAFNKAKGTSLSNVPLTPEYRELLAATADMMVQGIRVKAWSFAEIVADLAETFGRENIPAMREYLERGWDAAVKIEGVKPANYDKVFGEFSPVEIKVEAPSQKPPAKQPDKLKQHKLKVERVGSRWVVSGKTFNNKQILKDVGGQYDASEKTWWFRTDPTDAIAARLPDKGDGEQSGDGRDSDADVERKRVRSREGERTDERGTSASAVESVGDDTKQLIQRGSKFGIPEKVLDGQVEDIGRVTQAFEAGKPMFLVGSAPGMGKSFILGGSIAEIRKRIKSDGGTPRFIYVTENQELISQLNRDLADYGVDDVEFVTYAGVRGKRPNASGAVVLIDEAHNAKNLTTKNGEAIQSMVIESGFTVYATATPFENVAEAKYLEASGIFDGVEAVVKRKDDRGRPYEATITGFDAWAFAYGAELYFPKNAPRPVVYWHKHTTAEEGQIQANDWLAARGVYTQRPMVLPPNMVKSDLRAVTVDDTYVEMFADVLGAYAEAEASAENQMEAGMIRAHGINLQKRILEASKVEEGISRAKELIADGKQVIIFVNTKADRAVGRYMLSEPYRKHHNIKGEAAKKLYTPAQIADMMDDYQRSKMIAKQMGDNAGPAPFAKPVASIAKAMGNRGIDFSLPSVTDNLLSAFSDGQSVEYTGRLTDAKAKENLAQWKAGEAKVIIATMDKGGTGLSYHDTTGKMPERVQVNINLPWSGTQVEQVSGRLARLGTAKPVALEWIFADNIPFERELSKTVGSRMRSMQAAVQGSLGDMAQSIKDFEFGDAPAAPPDRIQQIQDTFPLNREQAITADILMDAVAIPGEIEIAPPGLPPSGRDVVFQISKASAKMKDAGKTYSSEPTFFKMWDKFLRAVGGKRLSLKSTRRAVEEAVEDIASWIEANPQYLDYYAKDMQAERDSLLEIYPELRDDANWALFKVISGIASNNAPLDGNVTEQINAYASYAKDGRIDATAERSETGRGEWRVGQVGFTLYGGAQGVKALHYQTLNTIIEQQGGAEGAVTWLMGRVKSTPSGIESARKSVGLGPMNGSNRSGIKTTVEAATGQRDEIPRAFAIFGPKVGAYVLNHLGQSEYTTVDVWESRFWRSFFKDVSPSTGLEEDTETRAAFIRAANAFAEMLGLSPSAAQAARWFYVIQKMNEAGYTYAREKDRVSVYTAREVAKRQDTQGADAGGKRKATKPKAGRRSSALRSLLGGTIFGEEVAPDTLYQSSIDADAIPKAVLDKMSRRLKSMGYDSRGAEDVLYQAGQEQIGLKGTVMAWTHFVSASKAIIGATDKADVSSFFHELGHPMRKFLFNRNVSQEERGNITDDDIRVIEDFVGVKDGEWTRPDEERFVDALMSYWMEGKAPTPELKTVFQKISEWLSNVLSVIARKVELTPEVRSIFDKVHQRGQVSSEKLQALKDAAPSVEATAESAPNEAIEDSLDDFFGDVAPSEERVAALAKLEAAGIKIKQTKKGWSVTGIPTDISQEIKDGIKAEGGRGTPNGYFFKNNPTSGLVPTAEAIADAIRQADEAAAAGMVSTPVGFLSQEDADWYRETRRERLELAKQILNAANESVDNLLSNFVSSKSRGLFKIELNRAAEKSDPKAITDFDKMVEYSVDHPELALPQTENGLFQFLLKSTITEKDLEKQIDEELAAELVSDEGDDSFDFGAPPEPAQPKQTAIEGLEEDVARLESKDTYAAKRAKFNAGPGTKGKQKALFDTAGDPDQMMMFDDGVTPEDMVYRPESEGDNNDTLFQASESPERQAARILKSAIEAGATTFEDYVAHAKEQLREDQLLQNASVMEQTWGRLRARKGFKHLGPVGKVADLLSPKPTKNKPEAAKQPDRTGPRVAGVRTPQEPFPDKQVERGFYTDHELTGIAKAVMNDLRELAGIPELEAAPPETIEQWALDAQSTMAADPNAPTRLLNEIISNPARALDHHDVMLLAFRYRELANQAEPHFQEMVDASKSGDSARIAKARTNYILARQPMTDFEELTLKAKSTWGRTGIALQVMLRKDNTVAGLLRRAREANHGKPLTPEQEMEMRDLAKRFADVQKKLDEETARADKAEAEVASLRHLQKLVKESPTRKRPSKQQKTELDAAWGEIAKLANVDLLFQRDATNPYHNTVQVYRDLGVETFAELRRHVQERLGKEQADKLEDKFKQAWEATKPETEVPAIIDRGDLGALTREARRIERSIVEGLMQEHSAEAVLEMRDEIVNAVHAEMQELLDESFTHRQTMDALSGYGQFSRPSQDTTDTLLRNLNAEVLKLRQIDQLGDAVARVDQLRVNDKEITDAEIAEILIKEGLLVAQTGLVRDTPTDTLRNLSRQYSELKKEIPASSEGRTGLLQTAIAAIERGLTNRIRDLNHAIKQEEPIKIGRKASPTNENIERLKEERDALLKDYLKLFPAEKKQLTPEQRLSNAIKAAEGSIAVIEKQLETRNFDKATTEALPDSPELTALKDRLKLLQAQRNAAKALELSAWEGEGGAVAAEKIRQKLSEAEKQQRSAERAIEKIQQKLKDLRDGKEATKSERPDLLEPELRQQLEAWRDKLKSAKQAAKDAELSTWESEGGAAPDPKEAAYRKAYIASLQNRIAKLQQFMREGDFSPQQKKSPRILSKAELDLKKQLAELNTEKMKKMADYHLSHLKGIAWTADKVAEVLHLARAIETSMDLSALGRQGGLIALGRPSMAKNALAGVAKSLVQSFDKSAAFNTENFKWSELEQFLTGIDSREAELAFMHQLTEGEDGEFRQLAGLDLPSTDQAITRQEEVFQGRWGKLVPGVAVSSRLYTMILNKMRADMFDLMVEKLGRQGKPTLDEAKLIANFINVMTGRSDAIIWQGRDVTAALNLVFFAPRYVASRFQYIAMPFYLPFKGGLKADWQIKRAIYREYARTASGATLVLGLIALAGQLFWDDDDEDKPTVGIDSTTSDFLKPKFGETRLDFLAGLQQIFVLSSRMAPEFMGGGRIGDKKFSENTGAPFEQNRLTVATRFARTKLAPGPGYAVTALNDWENVVGQKADNIFGFKVHPAIGTTAQLFAPLSTQSIVDAFETQSVPVAAATSTLSILGVGMSTYGPKTEYMTGTPEERQEQVEKDLKRVQWDSPAPSYAEFLTKDQLNKFENVKHRKYGQKVSDATGEPESESGITDRDEAIVTLKESGYTYDQAKQSLVDYLETPGKDGKKNSIRENGKVKPSVLKRFTKLRKIFASK